MLYTEGTGMLEGSFSKESVEQMIFLLRGSLQEIQEEGKMPKPMVSSLLFPLINFTSLLLKYHVNVKDRDHYKTNKWIPSPK